MNATQEETQKLATKVFQDEATALDWLRQENVMLGGMRPLDLMQTEEGNVSVRRILASIGAAGMV